MTSFLSKKRDDKSYEERLATVPEQTRRNKMYAIKVFKDFVQENYDNRTIHDVIEELQVIRKTKKAMTQHYMICFKTGSTGMKK